MIALDGRLARRETTRSAVVDALLALIEEGDRRPTAPRIAERAGVSLRSVFQHFTDLEALFAVAADRQTARIAALVHPVPTTGPLRGRIDVFVAQRARVCEAVAPVRRAALLMEPFSHEIAGRLRRGRTLARGEVARVFARELARRRPAARRELLEALTVASAWSTWEALRAHQRLSVPRARAAMRRLVATLLNEED
jgi:AcrR family transcriptional regulator